MLGIFLNCSYSPLLVFLFFSLFSFLSKLLFYFSPLLLTKDFYLLFDNDWSFLSLLLLILPIGWFSLLLLCEKKGDAESLRLNDYVLRADLKVLEKSWWKEALLSQQRVTWRSWERRHMNFWKSCWRRRVDFYLGFVLSFA